MATSPGKAVVGIEEVVSAAVAKEESAENEAYNDNYYCDRCKCFFKTQCEVHGPPIFALDSPTPMGTPQRDLLTLPAGLVVGRSRVKEGSLGIFNQGPVVPVGVHFGPYDGEVTSAEEALKSVYSWVICKGRNCFEFIDATRDTQSNWMRFVICSRSSREQNLVAFQQGGRLLFRCCSPIRPGQELLVWYSEEYARDLGLTWDQLWDYKRSSTSTNTDNDSSHLSCPHCQFSFPAKFYLQRHVRRSHAAQYPSFLETHCPESKEVGPSIDLDTCLLGSDVPPSAQMEPNTDAGEQGNEPLIGRAPCQSGTSEQSLQSNGMGCWNGVSDSDWSKDRSTVSPTSEKGHSCPRCGRTFARAYHLKRHEEAVHSPDKLYWYRQRHRSLRKPSNPQRHRQSPEVGVREEEEEEEEEEERSGCEEKGAGAPLVYLCSQCSIAFMTQQNLQEHVEEHHSQDEGSNSQGGMSDASVMPQTLSSREEFSEATEYCDPSDPPYEPPSRKHNTRKSALKAPSQKRGRGRPRKRIALPIQPKRKRPQKILTQDGEPQPQAQTHICSQCGMVLADAALASSHSCCAQTLPQPGTQTGTQLTCAECHRMFADLATLQSHNCVQEGEGLYSCPQCSLHFSQPSNLRRHQRTVHALMKPYCCGPCGKFYTQASGLKRHQEGRQHKRRQLASASTVALAIATSTTIYSCTYCQFSFTTQRYLHKHIKRHHPTEFVQALDGDPWGTGQEEEGEGEGGVSDRLAEVQARVTQSCPQCEKTFVSVKGFKSHRCFRHSDKIYSCLVCKKRFNGLYSLRQHERIHTGEKPYTCQHCGKSFTVGGQLNVHLRTHTGERPYLCAQCGKGFRQSGDLKRHEQKHLGVRPHQCPQCSKSFSRPQSLRAHLQTHTGRRLFHCRQCNKSFTRGYHLTRHCHKMHS